MQTIPDSGTAQSASITLLLRCDAVSSSAPDHAARIRQGIALIDDWRALLDAAGHHGLLSVLTAALRNAKWPSVPPEIRLRLEARQQTHVRKTLAQVAALHAICSQFHESNLRAISWKGPLLALELYGSAVTRESGDLDFLLEPRDLAPATKLLEAMAFRKHSKTGSSGFDDRIARLDRDHGFLRESDGVYVELHTQTMPARFTAWQNRAQYMGRAITAQLGGITPVLTLCPEDHLLSLCSHGIKHHWERLKWVQDIALFVRAYRSRLDWAALLEQTRYEGKSRALVHSAALAAELYGEQLPTPLGASPERAITAAVTQSLATTLRRNIRELSAEQETSSLMALLFPSRLGRLRFAAQRALEPQLCDFNDTFSRSVLLCKWHRLLQQAGPRGALNKAAVSLRRIW